MTPLLVSSQEPSFWALYIYLAVVTAAAFVLANFRLWLWLAVTDQGPGIADVDLAAQLTWAALHGLASLRITKHYEGWVEWKPAKKSASAMIDALLHGLLEE